MVPPLSPLLDVQEIDLTDDRLTERHRSLPERDELQRTHQQTVSLDNEHAQLLERREALGRSEHALGGEVAVVAAKAKEIEDVLYSGSVKIPKELEGLQQEIRMLRERQSGLEEQELELLEEIEQSEGEIEANRSQRAERGDSCLALEEAIREAETKIDGEQVELAGKRAEIRGAIPVPILAEYDRLREKERLAGRAVAPLTEGGCGGCRVRLPVFEFNRIKAEPDDVVIFCVHCGRLLVR